ncbi:MAG: heavy metal translocating P-type ATPase [Tannerellaceae bacterium]|jgi:Cd2+/Zn2+-exporting ATPase|nr:heavy metal translocating P-type ATPase [Tannerellaceae bacterium]
MSENSQSHAHCCCREPEQKPDSRIQKLRKILSPLAGLILLVSLLVVDHLAKGEIGQRLMGDPATHPRIRPFLYLGAYLLVALPVARNAWESLRRKDPFNEYSLMLMATLGAFCIGEYPEALAVMVFYSIGELFQDAAVNKARRSIKALLDIRPATASVWREERFVEVSPQSVQPGETLLVKVGGRVPLDGRLLSEIGRFNTAALTGESRPQTLYRGDSVPAGAVSIDKVVEIKAEKAYRDSSLARILDLVQEAASRKAHTELLIRRFARAYTPAVFCLALGIAFLPRFFMPDYVLTDWVYRALVFLVISCPCALVISVPLGYFGGIGAASQQGILFKGANYLDRMASINTVVMDKTGTVTKGVFRVREVSSLRFTREELLGMAASVEKFSTHPVAGAIVSAWEESPNHPGDLPLITQVEEIPGMGMKGLSPRGEILAGNRRLMHRYHILYDEDPENRTETVVLVAVGGCYAGCITISDEVREDAPEALEALRREGVSRIWMLSGDTQSIVTRIARAVGIDQAWGDLLPEGKVRHIEALKANPANRVAFVGDGINDAPVLALSDVGIAMGGMGSDAAIEVADVVIQTDRLSRLAPAIRIARATKRIVMQNIALALGTKSLVMLLGACGLASLWEAVFADVGVALVAVLNSVRILRMKFGPPHETTP